MSDREIEFGEAGAYRDRHSVRVVDSREFQLVKFETDDGTEIVIHRADAVRLADWLKETRR